MLHGPRVECKVQKRGKALCTLYPVEGAFSCMVVIGDKKQNEAELLLPALDPYVQQLYQNAKSGMGGRWLMVDVATPAILASLQQLIALRQS